MHECEHSPQRASHVHIKMAGGVPPTFLHTAVQPERAVHWLRPAVSGYRLQLPCPSGSVREEEKHELKEVTVSCSLPPFGICCSITGQTWRDSGASLSLNYKSSSPNLSGCELQRLKETSIVRDSKAPEILRTKEQWVVHSLSLNLGRHLSGHWWK